MERKNRGAEIWENEENERKQDQENEEEGRQEEGK